MFIQTTAATLLAGDEARGSINKNAGGMTLK